MNLAPEQLYNLVFITVCMYLILSGLGDILDNVTTPGVPSGLRFQTWTEALFKILSGLVLFYLMYSS
jgi:hypothetical protein